MDFNDEIVDIVEMEEDDLLDIEVSGNHLFYANDILTKNSISIGASADFCAAFGKSEDILLYEGEMHYKIIKNRIGGRVGSIDKFFVDARSLKMYDSNELDLWISDAKSTGDKRKSAEKKIDETSCEDTKPKRKKS